MAEKEKEQPEKEGKELLDKDGYYDLLMEQQEQM